MWVSRNFFFSPTFRQLIRKITRSAKKLHKKIIGCVLNLLLPWVHGYWIPLFPFLQTCVVPASRVSDISGRADVRFTPNSRHWRTTVGCPLCAKSGHMQRNKNAARCVGSPHDRAASATPATVKTSAAICESPSGSCSAIAETTTPITGTSIVPIAATEAGRRSTAPNQVT